MQLFRALATEIMRSGGEERVTFIPIRWDAIRAMPDPLRCEIRFEVRPDGLVDLIIEEPE